MDLSRVNIVAMGRRLYHVWVAVCLANNLPFLSVTPVLSHHAMHWETVGLLLFLWFLWERFQKGKGNQQQSTYNFSIIFDLISLIRQWKYVHLHMFVGVLKTVVTMVLFKSFKKLKNPCSCPPSYKPTYGESCGTCTFGGGTWPQEIW